jgi:hypothetical protein
MEKDKEVARREVMHPQEIHREVDCFNRQSELEEERHAMEIARVRRDAAVYRLEETEARATTLKVRKETERAVLQIEKEIEAFLFPRVAEKPKREQRAKPTDNGKRVMAELARLRREFNRLIEEAPEEDRAFLTWELRKREDQIKEGGKI